MKRPPNSSRRLALLVCCALLSLPLCRAENGAAAGSDKRMASAYAVLLGQQLGDRASALTALRELAGRDHAAAANILGFAYYRGLGVTPDRGESIKWWRQAASLGDIAAAYNAGLLLLDQSQSVEALALLEQAATGGDAVASFVLGSHLAEGKQSEAAEHWLQQAAASGYAPAQYNLAVILNAEPDDKDSVARARSWLTAAAPTFLPAAELLARLDERSRTSATSSTMNTPAVIHDIAWVLQQAPEHYTIQVAAGRTAAAIRRLLKRHHSDDPAAWFMHRPRSGEPFSAVVGSYTAYNDAELALQKLPPRLRNNAPWIRRFGVLHEELARVKRGGLASGRDDVQAAH